VVEGYEIRAVEVGDSAAVAAAYRRNREHLAPWDPERPEEFWTDAGQEQDVARQVTAAEDGRTHSYLLWHGDGPERVVVGRAVLTNIVRGHMQSAVLGYWVDHEHQGRGLATAFVEHLVGVAEQMGLHRLEAGTMLDNVGSQRVLERSGFTRIGVAEGLLFIRGAWQDHVLFQRLLHDDPQTGT
jgi:ribosomal-protein-alanine N-acetyltransferase